MNTNKYVQKSAAEAKKVFTDFTETKKRYGNKTIPVFFDFTMLDKTEDIPEDIKQTIKTEASEKINRLDPLFFGEAIINPFDGLQYYVDLDGITYNVIDDKKDKLLYSVIEVKSIRFVAYQTNIFGIYEGLPVKSNSYNWNENIHTAICDLYYNDEKAC